MSDWTDDNGVSLGEWKLCTPQHATYLLYDVLGDERTVFSSRTDMGDDWGVGQAPRNRHIHTEWGRKGDATPLVRCEKDSDSWGLETHFDYEFVRSDFTVLGEDGEAGEAA